MTSILLTGANGFVGKALVSALKSYPLRALGRTAPDSTTPFIQAPLNETACYKAALKDIDVVIHAAARVHVMQDNIADPLAAYREINVLATLNLARQAAAAGVKRFIFISSIKVNGEFTLPGQAFSAFDKPSPADPYGQSKAEAEHALLSLAEQSGMQVVIIRPPLIYGEGVKANFAAMLKLAAKGLPLPFGAIDNKRSMVALPNLVSLIELCITHPAAANQIFLVSDNNDLSTKKLIQLMAQAAGKTAILLPIPVSWFNFLGKITGKHAVVSRLCGNLQLNIEHTINTLSWQPATSPAEGIKGCISKEDLC